ncbi:MAG: ABC transporter ATP-binding protein [Alphaproteobacteria bacterium]|nr:ABC transporter ATP-binding protein [Alphaproteobacteria bacterium]
MAALLEVEGLSIAFAGGQGARRVVDEVSFTLERARTLALVGESGSGKSVTALSVPRLLPCPPASYPSGSIRFEGRDILHAEEAELLKIRGSRIAMVFQEPMTSLNPLQTIAAQVGEALLLHQGLSRESARARSLELLTRVRLQHAEDRLDAYPHQLSGGQRQRVMIAMALANRPDLLIADEPTTALDVTVQAEILALLKELQAEMGLALLLITHDLGMVQHMADEVAVMKEGRIVEAGPTRTVFAAPAHDYTRRLLASRPSGLPPAPDTDAKELLSTEAIKVHFPIRKGFLRKTVGHVKAVDGLSLCLREGETVGVVGESGSGKTTLGLAVLRLIASEGAIRLSGTDIAGLKSRALRPLRREMQIVFQDPYGALSPRLSVGEIVGEGLSVHGIATSREERRRAIAAILEEVGLPADTQDRYPHEFSGGQRQRIAIARAMILKPRLVVLDEPTSALDMSVQSQIVELLRSLQARHRLGYLFISHDLAVVRALAHRVIVMKDGRPVETGETEALFANPQADYTRALMAAAFARPGSEGASAPPR